MNHSNNARVSNDGEPLTVVERHIYLLRGHKVMVDSDLARLYGVEVKHLKRQVRRNKVRFPADFMFQLRPEEEERLRRQNGTSKEGRGGRRYPSLVFTEQGVAMLSSVLHSQRAILVNIAIMRAFVKLRELIASNKDLARKLEELEKRYDDNFSVVFRAIRELMAPEAVPPKHEIGFTTTGQR